MNEPAVFYRRCSNCKKPIALGAKFWVCSVSSCQRVRSPIQFCSPDCFEVHNEVERHKDGWALERIAPMTPDAEEQQASQERRMTTTEKDSDKGGGGDDVLVVVSRVKDFIKQKSNGMNTSAEIVPALSTSVKQLADAAIDAAKKDGRKTVMGRDIPRPGASGGDVLVVVSRLKSYIAEKGDMRTSDEVLPVISEEIRRLSLAAIENARKDGRKTVMGRDFTVA
jgi:histone H3/H4